MFKTFDRSTKNALEIHSIKFEHILILLQVLHEIVRIRDCGQNISLLQGITCPYLTYLEHPVCLFLLDSGIYRRTPWKMALLRDSIHLFPTLPLAKYSTGDIHGK